MNLVSIWGQRGRRRDVAQQPHLLIGCWQYHQRGDAGFPPHPSGAPMRSGLKHVGLASLPYGKWRCWGWSSWNFSPAYILTSRFCKGKLISWLFPLGSVVGYPGNEGIKWARPSGIRRHPGGIRYGWYLIQELRFFCFIDLTYLWLYTHNGLHYECHVDLRSCQ